MQPGVGVQDGKPLPRKTKSKRKSLDAVQAYAAAEVAQQIRNAIATHQAGGPRAGLAMPRPAAARAAPPAAPTPRNLTTFVSCVSPRAMRPQRLRKGTGRSPRP